MSTGVSLSLLLKRKSTVKEGMSNSREMIDAANEKIDRLEEAISKLEQSIETLVDIQENVENYETTKSKWEGTREKEFEGKYNSYNIYLKKYCSDTDKAKELLEEALESAKTDRNNAQIGLGNLQTVLNGLESDIALARARG